MAKKNVTPAPEPELIDDDLNLNTDLGTDLGTEPEIPGDPETAEAPKATKGGKIAHDAWYCQIKGGKAEKLKIERKGVMITEEQAATLNEGVLHGSNAHGTVYFPSGE